MCEWKWLLNHVTVLGFLLRFGAESDRLSLSAVLDSQWVRILIMQRF